MTPVLSLPTTLQELFNNAWQHAVVDKAPPAISNMGCVYRGPQGTCCLIGVNIPDILYNPNMEYNIASELGLWDDPRVDQLQSCHDRHIKQGDYYHYLVREELIQFAYQHHLQIPT